MHDAFSKFSKNLNGEVSYFDFNSGFSLFSEQFPERKFHSFSPNLKFENFQVQDSKNIQPSVLPLLKIRKKVLGNSKLLEQEYKNLYSLTRQLKKKLGRLYGSG